MPHNSPAANASPVKPIISVQLFDADGSIFNPQFMKLKKYTSFLLDHFDKREIPRDQLLVTNAALFNSIKQQIHAHKPEQVIVMCGSNRQSEAIDSERNRMSRTGSFFPVLNEIVAILNKYAPTTLDSMLLADLFSNNPPGFAYHHATHSPDFPSHPRAPLEESKFILIYATMHHLACKYPDHLIHVDFYDDHAEILNDLKKWLNQNSDLIPNNITLNLHQYAGDAVTPQYSVVGTMSAADSAYPETAKILAYMGGLPLNFNLACCNETPTIKLSDKIITSKSLHDARARWVGILKEAISSPSSTVVIPSMSKEAYEQLSKDEKEEFDLQVEDSLRHQAAIANEASKVCKKMRQQSSSTESNHSEASSLDASSSFVVANFVEEELTPRRPEGASLSPRNLNQKSNRERSGRPINLLLSNHHVAQFRAAADSVVTTPTSSHPDTSSDSCSYPHIAPDTNEAFAYAGEQTQKEGKLTIFHPSFFSPTSSTEPQFPLGSRNNSEIEIDSTISNDERTSSRNTPVN